MMKRLTCIVFALLFCFSLSAFAEGNAPRLYDGADLLTTSEETALLSRLDAVSEEYSVEFVIVTVDSVGSYSADGFAENYYDENNFGYGERRDGVLLLVAMEERDYRILSNGLGADAISPYDIDSIGETIAPSLSEGSYATAFNDFIDECEYLINGEINGFPFNFLPNLLISLAIGFVVAFIATACMKRKLRSVRRQSAATEYAKPGSMRLTLSNEIFLYRVVDRHKKASNNSSSARSSGGSRNIGGGKF